MTFSCWLMNKWGSWTLDWFPVVRAASVHLSFDGFLDLRRYLSLSETWIMLVAPRLSWSGSDSRRRLKADERSDWAHGCFNRISFEDSDLTFILLFPGKTNICISEKNLQWNIKGENSLDQFCLSFSDLNRTSSCCSFSSVSEQTSEHLWGIKCWALYIFSWTLVGLMDLTGGNWGSGSGLVSRSGSGFSDPQDKTLFYRKQETKRANEEFGSSDVGVGCVFRLTLMDPDPGPQGLSPLWEIGFCCEGNESLSEQRVFMWDLEQRLCGFWSAHVDYTNIKTCVQ